MGSLTITVMPKCNIKVSQPKFDTNNNVQSHLNALCLSYYLVRGSLFEIEKHTANIIM